MSTMPKRLTVDQYDQMTAATDTGIAGGIPACWIVNLPTRQLEVYLNPVNGSYPTPTILGETESVDLIIGGQVIGQIAVADLLPRGL